MEDRFIGFNEKRMHIFSELVRRYWNGSLNYISDLDDLAAEIKEKYGYGEHEIPFIKDHIRLAMGLDPNGKELFEEELQMLRRNRGVHKPLISRLEGPCAHCGDKKCRCDTTGKYESPLYHKEPEEERDECIECGFCAADCDFGAIAEKIEFLPMVELLKERKSPIFAVVAPAITGQFGENVTMGKLRTAFQKMGFDDMIEVALFADILTIKEAFEFNRLVKKEEDFFLTSCCCPVWFNLIKRNYPDIYEHLSPSVSPMIASGRILKRLYPDAKIVFFAPCTAKKAEALEEGLKGAVDFVINFRELKEIFHALDINLEDLPPNDKDLASLGGRVYARTGGVSFSVKMVVNRLDPTRLIKLKSKKVDGVKECRELLETLRSQGKDRANFIEGMACKGGCVGGPRTNIDTAKATELVNEFGEDSLILTPLDNLNAVKILKQFNILSVADITKNEELEHVLSRE
ncbi:iron hydrogenase [Anoxybacterium hadale]|uniref:Iron hydrogenase n=1 Tax=Anoxybacterium hadale TaxID=3408580 RepID=A0ACD1AHE7_9FIRM|nr:iron hydrogenase [Clostridiales bacterium]